MDNDNDNVSYMYGEDYHEPDIGVTTIEVDKDEYDELISNSLFLDALEQAGVDNWDGYDLAQEIFDAFKA